MAVAIRERGYLNVKIYNGGMKDWRASGFTIEQLEPLPAYKTTFWSAEELKTRLDEAGQNGCRAGDGSSLLTLLDLRISRIPEGGERPLVIDTICPTVTVMLDDLQKSMVRQLLTQNYPVVVVTETGNRDDYASRYLTRFGYENVYGLRFGMRGWIKANYPTRSLARGE